MSGANEESSNPQRIQFTVCQSERDEAEVCPRACVPDHSLLVPPHLQELYEMYMRVLDEGKLDRAMALDKVTTRHTIKVPPPPPPHAWLVRCRNLIGLDEYLLLVIPDYFQEGSLPKITLPGQGRDNMQDLDSDQESVRNMYSDIRRGQAKIRRHTLPPILPEPEL